MKITENFKNKLKIAKDLGKKRVYRIVGSYKATTYCTFHNINDLISDEIGTEYRHQHQRWSGHDNTRQCTNYDIMFSDVHAL